MKDRDCVEDGMTFFIRVLIRHFSSIRILCQLVFMSSRNKGDLILMPLMIR